MSIDIHDYLIPLDYTVDLSKLAAEQTIDNEPKCKIINSRIPHTINKNTTATYAASPETAVLHSEENRKIHPENIEWNKNLPPLLTDCCVDCISKNYEKLPLLRGLPCDNRSNLMEILPTSLPLTLVVPLIDYEYYWQRRYTDEFGIVTYPKRDDWNWKKLYLERYTRKLMEEAQPQHNDEFEMDEILTLLEPFVQTLTVTQLQIWKPPLTMDPDDIPDVYPDDHIDFTPVFNKLTKIDEFDLVFAMNNVAEDFEWRMFKISLDDCTRLGKAVHQLKFLKILRIHRSRLYDLHCRTLMKGLIENQTLMELDLSHCRIGDLGALCIAKLLMVHPTLVNLILTDNQIGDKGSEGIGFALLQENSSPINYLDLRLNPLGHQGCMGMFKCLARCNKPEKINLACCGFEDETAYIFGFLLKINRSLTWIDVSNNWFGEFAGESLISGLEVNETVKWLDVRETNLTAQQKAIVRNLIRRNNNELITGISQEQIQEEAAPKPKVTIVVKDDQKSLEEPSPPTE